MPHGSTETGQSPTPHRGARHFTWMRLVSIGLFAVGLVLIVLGETTGLGATVTLTGGMLVIAGIVKVITVRLWDGFFAEELAHHHHADGKERP